MALFLFGPGWAWGAFPFPFWSSELSLLPSLTPKPPFQLEFGLSVFLVTYYYLESSVFIFGPSTSTSLHIVQTYRRRMHSGWHGHPRQGWHGQPWQGQQWFDNGGRHDRKHGGDQGRGGWHDDQGHRGGYAVDPVNPSGNAAYWRHHNQVQKTQKKARQADLRHNDSGYQRDQQCHGRTAVKETLPAYGKIIDLATEYERKPVTKPAESPHERKDITQRLKMRQREMTKPSNYPTKSRHHKDGISRHSESTVSRFLWPFGQKLMNDKVKEKCGIHKWWDCFVDKWKQHGEVANVRQREETLKLYIGGEGNYILTLSGLWRWQGFFCF